MKRIAILTALPVLILHALLTAVEPPQEKLELYPTFNSVSVYLNYTDDSLDSARVSIHYRKAGAPAWRQAHYPVKIEAEEIGGRFWTGSLLFLAEGTTYEVKLTVSTSEEASAAREILGTVTTRRTPNTSKGQTIVVNPGESIQPALDLAGPGVTVLIKSGVYSQKVTVNKSGTADAPITIKGEPGAAILGSDPGLAAGKGWTREGGTLYSAQVSPLLESWEPCNGHSGRVVVHEKFGRLYHFSNLEELRRETHECKRPGEGRERVFKFDGGWTQKENKLYLILPDHSDPRRGGVHVSVREACISLESARHITIEGLELAYAASCFDARTSSNTWIHHNNIHGFEYRGIYFYDFPGDDNLIERNYIANPPEGEWRWSPTKGHDAEDDAVCFKSGRGNVIRNNVIHSVNNGLSISSWRLEPQFSRDADINDNYLIRVQDDPIEPDGFVINHRTYQNVIINSKTMGFSLAPVWTGPWYIVRNVVSNFGLYVLKAHNNSGGHVFVYHNSSFADKELANGGINKVMNSARELGGIVARNNMFWALDYMLNHAPLPLGPPCSFDYNVYYNPRGSYLFNWLDHTDIGSLEEFQAIGQEEHGFVSDPRFTDSGRGDLTIVDDSPLRDRGVLISGINDQTPDGRPDIGAYETGQPRWDRPEVLPEALRELLKPSTLTPW